MADDKPKNWLDEIVQPTALSQRRVPRLGEIKVSPANLQLQRFLKLVEHIQAQRWASAAHVRREWIANNPWRMP